MTMQRFDPFAEMRRMDSAFNRLWNPGVQAQDSAGARWDIAMDVVQDGDDLIVRASLPGVDPDDIQVTLEDGLLTIEGETGSETQEQKGDYLLRERRFGRFHRALRLPNSVDAEQAQPSYANGVLTITVPKQEAKKARRLEIKTG
ncbi:MAG: Hsp20/alpha crystallin family protein [Dehalococcoidia bacterium]|nr:Hsp20/alpha crystallin family protein [Dehalococcoidia bacterium]